MTIAAKNTSNQYEIQLWTKLNGMVTGDRNLLSQLNCDYWIVGANHLDYFYDRIKCAEMLEDGSLQMYDGSSAWNPCRIAVLDPNKQYLFEYDVTVMTTDSNGRVGLYDFHQKTYKGQFNYKPQITQNSDGTFHWKGIITSPSYKCIAIFTFWQGASYPIIKFSNPSLKLINHYIVT